MPKYFIYILRSSNNKFYVGYTTDIERRMRQHRRGAGSKFVRGFGFDKLLYKEECATKSAALKREAEIKSWTRGKKEALLKGAKRHLVLFGMTLLCLTACYKGKIMAPSTTVDELVKLYNLQSHPEGGFYNEYYRDKGIIPKSVLPSRFKGDRNYSANIYYLLPEGKKSNLHRIASDESWHFYLGGPLTVIQISPEGETEKITLGQDVAQGQKVAHVVPAGYWFGAAPNAGSRYSFVGCTVAPGFDFADFEMGTRSELLKQFPRAKEAIEILTD